MDKYLRSANAKVRVYPVEPAEVPGLSQPEHQGHHRIQGISDEFVQVIVGMEVLDTPIVVSDGDAILMVQAFAITDGTGAGISSGCNFLAAVQAQNELNGDAVVVTVFADDNKKYLSTDLMQVRNRASQDI